MHLNRTSDVESGFESDKGQISSLVMGFRRSWTFQHEEHRHTCYSIVANNFGHCVRILSHRRRLP